MDVSLVMVVRDEAHSLLESIPPALEACSELVIVDTGSKDGTVDLLRDRFGVIAHHFQQSRDDRYNIVPARNFGLSLATRPWILTLDADEVLTSRAVSLLHGLSNDREEAGFFGPWINSREGVTYRDYKLFLFRNKAGISFLGRVHAVPQTAIRSLGLTATWLAALEVEHRRRPRRLHRNAYVEQMMRGMVESPHWTRYHWFFGYSLYKEGNTDAAEAYLSIASEGSLALFPVEALNAGMVLSEIYASRADVGRLREVIGRIGRQLEEVGGDFEVRVNEHALWLKVAEAALRREQLSRITAPEFAY